MNCSLSGPRVTAQPSPPMIATSTTTARTPKSAPLFFAGGDAGAGSGGVDCLGAELTWGSFICDFERGGSVASRSSFGLAKGEREPGGTVSSSGGGGGTLGSRADDLPTCGRLRLEGAAFDSLVATRGRLRLDPVALFSPGRGLGVALTGGVEVRLGLARTPPDFFGFGSTSRSSVVSPATACFIEAWSPPSLAASSSERVMAILSSKSWPMNSASCSSSKRSGQACSIARANSRPVAKRCSRFFDRPFITTSDSSGVT